jgi:hypothetical protein
VHFSLGSIDIAMDQMNPTSSRATAVIATCDFLPRPKSFL